MCLITCIKSLFGSFHPLVVAHVCLCMLADTHACTHAIASVFIICACMAWQSGKITEGFPQRPRCQSVCSVKGEDHLPGLGEISATCRCWGIYPSTQGKKKKGKKKAGVRTHREWGVWPRNSDLMVKCSMHNLKVCHTFFWLDHKRLIASENWLSCCFVMVKPRWTDDRLFNTLCFCCSDEFNCWKKLKYKMWI